MKQAIVKFLQQEDLSHADLIKKLETSLKDIFFDNISWYAETLVLDLQARGIIEKKEKYHLK